METSNSQHKLSKSKQATVNYEKRRPWTSSSISRNINQTQIKDDILKKTFHPETSINKRESVSRQERRCSWISPCVIQKKEQETNCCKQNDEVQERRKHWSASRGSPRNHFEESFLYGSGDSRRPTSPNSRKSNQRQSAIKSTKKRGLDKERAVRQQLEIDVREKDRFLSKTTIKKHFFPKKDEHLNNANHLPRMCMQSSLSFQSNSTPYLTNPTQDPRFQSLVALLVPNKASTTNDVTSGLIGNEEYVIGREQENDLIYFHDVCLVKTCQMIYRLMRIDQ